MIRTEDAAPPSVSEAPVEPPPAELHPQPAQRAAVRRAMFEAIPAAITVLRRDGTIVDFKPAPEVPIPMAPETLIGKKLRELKHAPTDRIHQLLERAFETGETHTFDYEAIVGDAIRIREATLRAVDEDEALWVVRDVTDQRTASERLAFADRMASLGSLAGGVAHEINNPLASVSANLAHLRSVLTEQGALPADLDLVFVEALTGLSRIRRVVTEMEALAQPGNDDSALVDIATAVTRALALARHELAKTTTVVEVDVTSGLSVRASAADLTQIILAFLLNAAQALDPASAETNRVRIRGRRERDHRGVLEISDNGAGVPETIRSRMFDPFVTTKPLGTATGLGLAIAKRLVRALGGEIAYEDGKPRGALFRVILPLVATPRVVHHEPSVGRGMSARFSGVKVLVVDDDEGVLTALVRMLRHFSLTAVATVDEAVRSWEAAPFDMVLCDVAMPDGGAVALHRVVAARWPERLERLVFMSGNALTDRQMARLGQPSPALIRKPFGVEEVVACLEQITARNEGDP